METLITLPLSDFLDILWGIKEFSIVDSGLGKSIASLDSAENFTHVEFSPLRQADGSTKEVKDICRVWRRKAWDSDYRQWLLSKELSEKRVADFDRLKATRAKITTSLSEKLSLDSTTAEAVAANLLKGDKEKIIQKIQQLLNITLDENEL